jgi:hypothetical protein
MSGRYDKSTQRTYTSASGVRVVYLEPRILPLADAPSALTTSVQSDEVHRLDLVAYRTLLNAELGWRVADANAAMDPFELVEKPGTALNLPPSQL